MTRAEQRLRALENQIEQLAVGWPDQSALRGPTQELLPEGTFWAIITAYDSATGAYSWERVRTADDGGFDQILTGDIKYTGSPTFRPAFERNLRADVPVDAYVLLRPRFFSPDGEDLHYEFAWGGGGGSTPQTIGAPLTIQLPSPVPTPAPPHILLPQYPDNTDITVDDGYIGIVNVGGVLKAIVGGGITCILCGGAGCSCCAAACEPRPLISQLTWVNQGDATRLINANGSVTLRDPAGSVTLDTHHLLFSIPSTPYRVDVEMELTLGVTAGEPMAGIAWRQSSDGKLVVFAVQAQGGSRDTEISGPAGNFHDLAYRVRKLTDPTTIDSDYNSYRAVRHPRFWRLQDDGTNRSLWWSMTGHKDDWLQLHSVGRTDYLTPDGGTVFVDASESEGVVAVVCCLKRYNYFEEVESGYELQSTATLTVGDVVEASSSYELVSDAWVPAEAGYEMQSSATVTAGDVVEAEAGYELGTETAAWPGETLPENLSVSAPEDPTLDKTLPGSPLGPYESQVFEHESQDVFWRLVYSSTPEPCRWILYLLTSPGEVVLARYSVPCADWTVPTSPTTMTNIEGPTYPSSVEIDQAALPDGGDSCANATAVTSAYAGIASELQTFPAGGSIWYSFTAGTFSSMTVSYSALSTVVEYTAPCPGTPVDSEAGASSPQTFTLDGTTELVELTSSSGQTCTVTFN